MPLKALWDKAENKRFNENFKQVIKDELKTKRTEQQVTLNANTRYMAASSNQQTADDQIAREHSNTRSVSFTASAQKNQ